MNIIKNNYLLNYMPELKNKTILITGAAGFLGSHLCDKYINAGHRVIGVDNLQTTYTAQNIEHLFGHPRFTFIKHDIVEPIDLKEKIDWIFNFGCPAQCVNLQWDPVHTLKTSVHGVINMLEIARRHNARIMQASTSEIYGHEPKNPQKESDCGAVYTLGPRACYDEGKRVSETLLMDYHRQYGVDVRIIRIFNTYGPRMYVRDGRVMSNFIIPALAGKPITIYGDGLYTRSFQFYTDLIDGIDRMMSQDGFLGPVNLGNPHEITIRELAETIIRLSGSRSEIIYKKAVTDDPVRRQPDISLAREKLGWEPKVSLEEGIGKTIEYFRIASQPDKKVLVYTTTYEPDMGPAEKALKELARQMSDTEFHVVTVKSRKNLSDRETIDNVHIYRIGSGNILGKYLFPIRGFFKGLALTREHRFRFVWSIMASYGALAALILKMFARDLNFLLTFHRSEMNKSGFKKMILAPIYKFIFRRADSVHLSDPELEASAKLYDPGAARENSITGEGKGLVDQVRHTFTHLLNKQEKKLDRPL